MCRKVLFTIFLLIPFFNGISQTVLIGKGADAKIIQAKDFEAEGFDHEVFLKEIKSRGKVKFTEADQLPTMKRCGELKDWKAFRSCLNSKLNTIWSKNFDDTTVKNSGVYKVVLQFIIDKEGDVADIFVLGPSPKAELSAIDVIKEFKFIPAVFNGENVDVFYLIPIGGLKR